MKQIISILRKNKVPIMKKTNVPMYTADNALADAQNPFKVIISLKYGGTPKIVPIIQVVIMNGSITYHFSFFSPYLMNRQTLTAKIDLLEKFNEDVMIYKLVYIMHEVRSPRMKRAGHPRQKKKQANHLSKLAVNILMRSRRIFPFILVATNNASRHSMQSRNDGSTRIMKKETFAAVLPEKYSLRSTSLRFNAMTIQLHGWLSVGEKVYHLKGYIKVQISTVHQQCDPTFAIILVLIWCEIPQMTVYKFALTSQNINAVNDIIIIIITQ